MEEVRGVRWNGEGGRGRGWRRGKEEDGIRDKEEG